MWQDPLACTTLLALGGGQESLERRTQAAPSCPFAGRRVVRQLKCHLVCLCIRFKNRTVLGVVHPPTTPLAQQTTTQPLASAVILTQTFIESESSVLP